MQTRESTTDEQLIETIHQFFGFMPPLFTPAQQTPHILHNLCQQTISVYIQNPIPLLFKEQLFAYLSRYCSMRYCVLCHSCALLPFGLSARDILALLETPLPTESAINAELSMLEMVAAPLSQWPESASALEHSLLACATFLFLQPGRAERCRLIIRHVLGETYYNALVEFLAYVKTCHFWVETHPEIAPEADKRVQDHLATLLADEPALATFFNTFHEKANIENEYVVRDHAARKVIEERLQATEEQAIANLQQLEATFEAMTDGVVVYDAAGQMLRINAAYRRMIALDLHPEHALLTPDERGNILALRDETGQLLPPDQRPVARMLSGEEMTGKNMLDIIVHTLDDNTRQLNVSGAPMRDVDGHIVGGVIIFRDVTQRRQNELALIEANRRMDEFMGIASHELKTPLTTIKGYVQLVSRRLKQSSRTGTIQDNEQYAILESASELLTRTDRQVERLGRLINELLDVSRIQANKLDFHPERCDLVPIVRDAVHDQLLESEAMTRTLLLDIAPTESVPIMADADRIGQVIANFLSNALKYSAEEQPVTVSLHIEGQTARLLVRDEGLGLKPEDQQQIWERFYRVEGIEVQSGSGIGLGLGLYICRTIIECHGGQVGVESSPGQGSTFWFSLPLAAEHEE